MDPGVDLGRGQALPLVWPSVVVGVTVGSVEGAAHRAFVDGSWGPRLGGLAAVVCEDCGWGQAVNEDLHEGFDHLADRDPGARLEVPGYVRWTDNGFGLLAVADERTGGIYDGYNHQSLAIFRSVAENGTLDAAMASEARRLGVSPRRVSGDIHLIATKFYQAGLLQLAREG
jgi:hypothetical protein